MGAARRPAQGSAGHPRGRPRAGASLRLALAGDAVDAIRAKHERLRADLDAWEAVSRATAFD